MDFSGLLKGNYRPVICVTLCFNRHLIISEFGLEQCLFELSTLNPVYMSDCMPNMTMKVVTGTSKYDSSIAALKTMHSNMYNMYLSPCLKYKAHSYIVIANTAILLRFATLKYGVQRGCTCKLLDIYCYVITFHKIVKFSNLLLSPGLRCREGNDEESPSDGGTEKCLKDDDVCFVEVQCHADMYVTTCSIFVATVVCRRCPYAQF